jgi:hypothetical protein
MTLAGGLVFAGDSGTPAAVAEAAAAVHAEAIIAAESCLLVFGVRMRTMQQGRGRSRRCC